MIVITVFIILSIVLIYLLKQLNRIASKGVILILKFLLTVLLGTQFFSIFQYGGEVTEGVPVKLPFFEEYLIRYLHLPHPEIQWLSLIFFLATVGFCVPKKSNDER